MARMLNLPDVLARWNIPFLEGDGWRDRGKAATFNPRGVLAHHDALNSSAKATTALGLMQRGRTDLPGPLCNLWIDDDRDDTGIKGDPCVYIIASGRANHAGRGNWFGLTSNDDLIGIEARNRGNGEPWSDPMRFVYMLTVAALLDALGQHSGWCAGHKEYALPRGRKPDPAGIDMNEFRKGVQALLDNGPPTAVKAAVVAPRRLPVRPVLEFGATGRHVDILQWQLAAICGANFPNGTGTFDLHTAMWVQNLGRVLGEPWDGKSVGARQWECIDYLFLAKGSEPIAA